MNESEWEWNDWFLEEAKHNPLVGHAVRSADKAGMAHDEMLRLLVVVLADAWDRRTQELIAAQMAELPCCTQRRLVHESELANGHEYASDVVSPVAREQGQRAERLIESMLTQHVDSEEHARRAMARAKVAVNYSAPTDESLIGRPREPKP